MKCIKCSKFPIKNKTLQICYNCYEKLRISKFNPEELLEYKERRRKLVLKRKWYDKLDDIRMFLNEYLKIEDFNEKMLFLSKNFWLTSIFINWIEKKIPIIPILPKYRFINLFEIKKIIEKDIITYIEFLRDKYWKHNII